MCGRSKLYSNLYCCQNRRLLRARKELPVQELVPEPAVERFAVAVLPGASRRDEQRLHPGLLQLLLNHLSHVPQIEYRISSELSASVWWSPIYGRRHPEEGEDLGLEFGELGAEDLDLLAGLMEAVTFQETE